MMMQIFVKTLSGPTFILEVDPHDTIESAKEQMHKLSGIPKEYQRWISKGKQLEHGYTFKDYNITKEDTIHNVVTLRGGGVSFEFSKLEEAQVILVSPKAPKWREAVDGTNIEGRCKNSNCEAFERTVIFPVGFCAINIGDQLSLCKCPMCDTRFVPTTCGFTNCRWKYEGTLANGEIKTCDWQKAPSDKYVRFDGDSPDQTTIWTSLIIESTPSDFYEDLSVTLKK